MADEIKYETTREKLMAIQSELNAPKNQYNKFGGYSYRSCEDIYNAVKPLLKKYGCVLTLTDEVVLIGERYYVKATATLKSADIKQSGFEISNTAYAREEETKKGMDGSQITGASSSYARKYALNGLFLIDDVRDSDTTNTHGKDIETGEEKAKKRAVPVTPIANPETSDPLPFVEEWLKRHEDMKPRIFKAYNLKEVRDVANLPFVKIDEMIAGMKKVDRDNAGIYDNKEETF